MHIDRFGGQQQARIAMRKRIQQLEHELRDARTEISRAQDERDRATAAARAVWTFARGLSGTGTRRSSRVE